MATYVVAGYFIIGAIIGIVSLICEIADWVNTGHWDYVNVGDAIINCVGSVLMITILWGVVAIMLAATAICSGIDMLIAYIKNHKLPKP